MAAIPAWATPPASLVGDANCDSLVAPDDLDHVRDELADGDGDATADVDGGAVVSCFGADANLDGRISVADLLALTRILYGESGAVGPVVTFLGIASADGTTTMPVSDLPAPLFQTVSGLGFRLVVEAMPGPSGLSVGQTIFNHDPIDPSVRPELQVEVSRDLGDGNLGVCGEGGVARVAPSHYGPEQAIANALNDLSCRFDVAANERVGCTKDEFGAPRFVDPRSRIQFCLAVSAVELFPQQLTIVTARVLDSGGNPGPVAQMILRVGDEPLSTATPRSTVTPQPSATTTDTVTPGPSPTASETGTPLPPPSVTATPPTQAATRTATATGPTPTRTRTPTETRPPTRTVTSLRTGTPTRTPFATRTPTGSRSPSPTVTVTRSPRPSGTTSASATRTGSRTATPTASITGSRPPTRTGTVTRTPSLTRIPTATGTRTPTRTPANTATFTRTGSPTRTGTVTRTRTVTRTPTRTGTTTQTPTISRTPTITGTRTQTGTPTATRRPGADITFVGLARADDRLIDPVGTTIPQGWPIYQRSIGYLFNIVVEAKPGPSLRAVGLSAFNSDPSNASVRPDFEIIVSRPLGDGSQVVCDNMPPTIGGVPASTSFNETQPISNAVNDFGCRFVNGAGVPRGRGPGEACTLFGDGEYRFKIGQPNGSTVQFCAGIAEPFAFPDGDTTVMVRARDLFGVPGPPATFIIRIQP